jgi:hypothetical protein
VYWERDLEIIPLGRRRQRDGHADIVEEALLGARHRDRRSELQARSWCDAGLVERHRLHLAVERHETACDQDASGRGAVVGLGELPDPAGRVVADQYKVKTGLSVSGTSAVVVTAEPVLPTAT